jgi:hypothetical protein
LLIAAAVLLPTVAILHATTTGNAANAHEGEHHDSDQDHQDHEDHDDNETSDEGVTHFEDANDNDTEIDD